MEHPSPLRRRRVVMLPQENTGGSGNESLTPNRVNNPVHMEVDVNKAGSSGLNLVKPFVTKCQMIVADLETSAITVEEMAANLDADIAKAELRDLEKLSEDYSVAHLSILRMCENLGLDGQEHQDRRRRFLIRLKAVRNQLIKVIPSETKNESEVSTSSLKLPRVEIPTFEGDFESWSSWHRLYESLIHKNGTLDDLQKFSFLRSRLKGTPLSLVDSLPFESSFYKAAFDMIVSHYNDPLKRISRLLDALVDSPSMGDKRQTLRGLITKFRATVTALQIIFDQNKEIDPMSQLFIHSFLLKADSGTRRDWEREMAKRKKFAKFSEFIEFVEDRCNAFERAGGSVGGKLLTKDLVEKRSKVCTVKNVRKCYYCSGNHTIYHCTNFLELSVNERKQQVKIKKLCSKCFSSKCQGKCPITCSRCKKQHNSLLHEPSTNKSTMPGMLNICETTRNSEPVLVKTIKDPQTSTRPFNYKNWVGNVITEDSEALLATAVLVVNPLNNEKRISSRALLDSGSQSNLITSKLVQVLNLNINPNYSTIASIDNTFSHTKGIVELKILSNTGEFCKTIQCDVVDEIVDLVPTFSFSIKNWNIPKNLILADPNFNVSSGIDLLLGLCVFWDILGSKIIKLSSELPCLRKSKLGWLIADDRSVSKENSRDIRNVLLSKKSDKLLELLEQFWRIEHSEIKDLSFEELECERSFMETTSRDESGRFIVRLPFKIPPERLGHSRSLALKRFLNLEKRFSKNHHLREEYCKCMNEYKFLGHMKEITEKVEEKCYYIPHHAVIKETSTSTKVRPVFDASMPTTSGLSLNSCLMVGPVVQSDLVSVIMRFRIHCFVFAADIVKMYRQITLHPEDTPYQRIFWRSLPTDPLKTYELTTVAFGTASAPFLATRCLKSLADSDCENFPVTKSVLLKDFYVDDVLTGADSLESAQELQSQLHKILLGAGFELSKWCANSDELLKNIPEGHRETNFPFSLGDEKVIKTLGLLWYPSEDAFRIRVQTNDISKNCSKRQVLSIIASIFDPVGAISPITVIAKLFMQSLWTVNNSSTKSKLNWDDELPDDLKEKWSEFSSSLPILNKFTLPRHVFGNFECKRIELHGFSDASNYAYGAVIYLRSLGQTDVSSRLLYSKSRVAPLKQQSIPRLELCAALLLAEMMYKVVQALQDLIRIDAIRLWSDSEIVLFWINSPSNRWQPFVANRVQKIQNFSVNGTWDHVNSKSNPADLISRGVCPTNLISNNLWWIGPDWLSTNTKFNREVNFNLKKKPVEMEFRNSKRALTLTTVKKSCIFQMFSNYWKLVRIVAWIVRFSFNSHESGPLFCGPLQTVELRGSLQILVELAQTECFQTERNQLVKNIEISKTSPLKSLDPFLNNQNIICVGGRLQNSELSYTHQHPFVLDPQHPFTKLMIRYFHEIHFHAGPQLLRSIIRKQFWVLRINSAIRHCITHCHNCIRKRAETRSQAMAALPKSRVTPSKPFLITGVDYAGPFSILGKGGRHKVIVKAYIAIFVCFTTKALHLELVSELTSECFLAALTRFISRRGIPNEIHSDNGTNFVGADALLKKQFKEFMMSNENAICNFTSAKGCQWHFIPPHAPHFGGLWEAGVKSVKSHLKSILANNPLTFEQWVTILTQIEACLNSRPLTPESSDPNELNALTPGHFLIGGPIIALPCPDLSNIPTNRLKHWTLLKSLSQKFWKRWSNEYLNTLQQRSKWRSKKDELKIGDMVILKEDNIPPTLWPLGRITELHLGSDKLPRVVTLKTVKGLVKRPITKLVYLPTTETVSN